MRSLKVKGARHPRDRCAALETAAFFKDVMEMADIIGHDGPISFKSATSLDDAMNQWEASVR